MLKQLINTLLILTIALLTFMVTFLSIAYITYELDKNIPEWVLMLSLYFPAIPVFVCLYLTNDGLKK